MDQLASKQINVDQVTKGGNHENGVDDINETVKRSHEENESVKQQLISMGFADGLVEWVMRKHPNQMDVGFLMELCLAIKQYGDGHKDNEVMKENYDNMSDVVKIDAGNTVKEEDGVAYGDPYVTQEDYGSDSDDDDDEFEDAIEM